MPSPPEGPGAAIVRLARRRGVQDRRVLEALAGIPRNRFVLPAHWPCADLDIPLWIGLDQTISQPSMVAAMTAHLALAGPERVLEVGTGSGYQAAVLARLAAEVFTIERHRALSLRARGVLDGLGLSNVRYRVGDGSLGWPEEAPFGRIIVTAAAPALPPALFDQLAEGGLLVAPIGGEETQQLTVVRKVEGRPEAREVMACRFVPLIGEQGWRGPA